jgi:hypothetical protein
MEHVTKEADGTWSVWVRFTQRAPIYKIPSEKLAREIAFQIERAFHNGADAETNRAAIMD